MYWLLASQLEQGMANYEGLNGKNWTGMRNIGLEWRILDWKGEHWIEWRVLDWNGEYWTGMGNIGLEWGVLDWNGEYWTGMVNIGLNGEYWTGMVNIDYCLYLILHTQ